MTKAELGAMICRVFALYFFFEAFQAMLLNGIYLFNPARLAGEAGVYMLSLFMVQFIGYGIIAVLFWFGAENLGKAVAGANPEKRITEGRASDAMTCVFVGFGLYFFSFMVPVLVEIMGVVYFSGTFKFNSWHAAENFAKLFLYFALAAYFLFGSAGLQRLVLNLRGRENSIDKNGGC